MNYFVNEFTNLLLFRLLSAEDAAFKFLFLKDINIIEISLQLIKILFIIMLLTVFNS